VEDILDGGVEELSGSATPRP